MSALLKTLFTNVSSLFNGCTQGCELCPYVWLNRIVYHLFDINFISVWMLWWFCLTILLVKINSVYRNQSNLLNFFWYERFYFTKVSFFVRLNELFWTGVICIMNKWCGWCRCKEGSGNWVNWTLLEYCFYFNRNVRGMSWNSLSVLFDDDDDDEVTAFYLESYKFSLYLQNL